MDAETILRIKPELTEYLHEYDGCFGRCNTRGHMNTYVQGQLSDLERKSVEPIADAADMSPRTLQEFLSLSNWDHDMMRDRLHQRIVRRHHDPHSVGIIDETSFVKKGSRTACVQRQHCGAAGKIDNCVVSVHLGYATPTFHTLLDGELFVPQYTWDADRDRCRDAGIADDVVYRSKCDIALAQYQRAVGNGVRFAWLTFDEGYGGKPPFLRKLDGLNQNYVAEVPANFHVWTKSPQVLHRRHARNRQRGASGGGGRPRRYPRLKVQNNPTATVQDILRFSPIARQTAWEKYHVKNASKGPMVFEAKRITVWLKDDQGLPTHPHHLLITRNVLTPNDVKFFISNAPPDTTAQTLLLVAFSRWKIERMFEDTKSELGMDHFEVRKFQSISRHLILSCVSHLFLAEFHQKHRGEKPRLDDLPGALRDLKPGPAVDDRRPLLAPTRRNHRRAIGVNTTPQCKGRPQSSQADTTAIAYNRRDVEEHKKMPMVAEVAL